MRRYPFHSRDAITSKNVRYLNENTLTSLKKLQKQLRHLKVRVEDLQFVIDRKGYVYVTDPQSVYEGDFGWGDESEIRGLREATAKIVRLRKKSPSVLKKLLAYRVPHYRKTWIRGGY